MAEVIAGQDKDKSVRPLLTDEHGKLNIVDGGLTFVAGGKTTSASPAVVIATGQHGAGYLTVVNVDDSAEVQIGLVGVGSTGFALPAGASITWRLAAVESLYVYGSGAVVSWALLS